MRALCVPRVSAGLCPALALGKGTVDLPKCRTAVSHSAGLNVTSSKNNFKQN